MDKETFSGAGRIWSTTMTDGTPVELKVDGEGNPLPLDYDDRQEYCNKVRQIRMSEFDQQVLTNFIKTRTLHNYVLYDF